MRKEKLGQLKNSFLELKNEENDEVVIDKTLELVEKILQFTEELIKDIDNLKIETKEVKEQQALLNSQNHRVIELLQLLAQLSHTDPEKALVLLRSIQITQNDNRIIN